MPVRTWGQPQTLTPLSLVPYEAPSRGLWCGKLSCSSILHEHKPQAFPKRRISLHLAMALTNKIWLIQRERNRSVRSSGAPASGKGVVAPTSARNTRETAGSPCGEKEWTGNAHEIKSKLLGMRRAPAQTEINTETRRCLWALPTTLLAPGTTAASYEVLSWAILP